MPYELADTGGVHRSCLYGSVHHCAGGAGTPPDKLTLDARKADAAGKSYGRWRFEESERRRKAEEIIHKQCEEHKRKEKKHVDESAPDPD